MMKFSDPPQVSGPLYTEIANSVIATLKREIDARMPPSEAENLRTHMLYLALSMNTLLKANELPDMDNKQRLFYVSEAMQLVEQCGTMLYFD